MLVKLISRWQKDMQRIKKERDISKISLFFYLDIPIFTHKYDIQFWVCFMTKYLDKRGLEVYHNNAVKTFAAKKDVDEKIKSMQKRIDDFIIKDDSLDLNDVSYLKNLLYKFYLEDAELDENTFYIESLEDDNIIYDSNIPCRLSLNSDVVGCFYNHSWYNLSELDVITLNKGERVYFHNIGGYLSGGNNIMNMRLTETTKTFDVGGDISTLIGTNTHGYDEFGNFVHFYELKYLFYFSKIVNADKLIIQCDRMKEGCCSKMFCGCTTLISAPKMPMTTLSQGCYIGMFYGCTNLTTAPELPATTLLQGCYASMFAGCKNLNYIKCLANRNLTYTSGWLKGVSNTGTFIKETGVEWSRGSSGIPTNWIISDTEEEDSVVFTSEEPNSTIGLEKISSNQMLVYKTTDTSDWTTMDTSTNIILNNIGDKVYIRGEMSGDNSHENFTQFKMSGKISASGNCNALWGGYLPSYNYCGYKLFYGCDSLITAPELPEKELTRTYNSQVYESYGCYQNMFYGCTGLTTAPKLPATILSKYCYMGMFYGCTGLTIAPELPSTELTEGCYQSMFYGCTGLTSAPKLISTILDKNCYMEMFYGCTGLTIAPELPSTELTEGCYQSMFYGCVGLTIAPELPAAKLVEECYNNMLYGCDNITYIKCLATYISSDNCTINWVKGISDNGKFIKDMNLKWEISDSGIPVDWEIEDVGSLNVLTFIAEEPNSTIGLEKLSSNQILEYRTETSDWINIDESITITLDAIGDKIYMRGILNGDNNNDSSIGDINYTQFRMTGKISASGNCNTLWNYIDINAPLRKYCGWKMFKDCISLTIAPELPATNLSVGCYCAMFSGCTGLTIAPKLPSTKTYGSCYASMFYGCTGLTAAPELPSNGTSYRCYYEMFYGCTGLTAAPELPAAILNSECYAKMFYGCSNISYIKCLAKDTISISNYMSVSNKNNWVDGVSNNGIFVKLKDAVWFTGVSGIPTDWVVEEI